MFSNISFKLISAIMILAFQGVAMGQTLLWSPITYQGRLKMGGSPIDSESDFEFRLWDDVSAGVQVAGPLPQDNVSVTGGLFTVDLYFALAAFKGEPRWLEISVRYPHDPTGTAPMITLAPRQQITAAPYALHTRGLFVDNAGNLGLGMLDPISKLDVAGDINTSTGYQIGNDTVLSTSDGTNLMVGVGAGANNTGVNGTFVGTHAGGDNAGSSNTFVGMLSGANNTTAVQNTFMGAYSGFSNRIGSNNTFLGYWAGTSSSSGQLNAYLGSSAGYSNVTGSYNTFLGAKAGYSNTLGSNTFVGGYSGYSNVTGVGNVFLGHQAGYFETGSNKLVIANGSNDNNVLIYGDFSTGYLGLGTTTPTRHLEINRPQGIVRITSTGNINGSVLELQNSSPTPTFLGAINFLDSGDFTAGQIGYRGDLNALTFDTNYANRMLIDSAGNVGIGTATPGYLLHVNGDAAKPGGGTWTVASDQRLKKNIESTLKRSHSRD